MSTMVRALPKTVSEILSKLDENKISPGLRFSTYFGGYNPTDWSIEKNKKLEAFQDVCVIEKSLTDLSVALINRQKTLFKDRSDALTLSAETTSPFATGLGNEHPLENGFSFLKPYGLPYLPGAGIKGVLRAAARDMGEEEGWSETKVRQFFGADPNEDAKRGTISSDQRGELIFVDAYPKMEKKSLTVEIMNPHNAKYLEGNASPSGTSAPIPVFFLAIAPKTEFVFNVSRVPCDGVQTTEGEWKELVVKTFVHAFKFFGFGAKTSVGYGAFKSDDLDRKGRQAEKERQESMVKEMLDRGDLPKDHKVWENAKLTYSPGDGKVKIVDPKGEGKAELDRENSAKLMENLDPEKRESFKKKKEMKHSVVVISRGNMWEFVQLKKI